MPSYHYQIHVNNHTFSYEYHRKKYFFYLIYLAHIEKIYYVKTFYIVHFYHVIIILYYLMNKQLF